MGGTERLSAFLDVSPDLLFYSCARTKSREKPGPDALCHGDPDDDCAVFSWIAVLHYSAICTPVFHSSRGFRSESAFAKLLDDPSSAVLVSRLRQRCRSL